MKNLHSIDLNLMAYLTAFYKEDSLTSAAKSVGLTQPAMSRVLQRLRTLFQDDLFITSRKGLIKTPKAARLEPFIFQALNDISFILEESKPFKPQEDKKCFKLSLSDYVLSVLLKSVFQKIQAKYPNIHFSFIPLSLLSANKTNLHQIDFILCKKGQPPPEYKQTALWEEKFVTVAHKDNPILKQDWNIDAFLSQPHVLWTVVVDAKVSEVDKALKIINKKRTIALQVPHFLLGFEWLENKNLIMVIPEKLYLKYKKTYHLVSRPLPLDSDSYTICLHWHPRLESDSAATWLKEQILNNIKIKE